MQDTIILELKKMGPRAQAGLVIWGLVWVGWGPFVTFAVGGAILVIITNMPPLLVVVPY